MVAARSLPKTGLVGAAAAVLLAATGPLAAPAVAAEQRDAGYIVVLRDSVASPSDVAAQHRRDHGAQVSHTYSAALKGYAARLTPTGRDEVARDRRVAYVEPDGVARAWTEQPGATWGLDRVDDRTGLDGTFTYTQTGSGVTAYVIDTGIQLNHQEFAGRASSGLDAIDGGSADDCNGHGTHVAGTVGGTTFGVAKQVQLVAVRVLDCNGSGSWSQVIAGIDWVTADHGSGAPAVANMSLGGGASSAVDTAVRNSIADGVSYAVAAGNGNMAGVAQDACKYSPARVAEAMTISATDKSDTKTSWANYGSCVDWFAPGAGITSAWIGTSATDTGGTKTISGTSMATPHSAGVAALHLQGAPGAIPADVRQALYGLTTKNVVKKSRSTNDEVLFTSY